LGIYQDVWVFNPRGWNRTAILGKNSWKKYITKTEKEILPMRKGFDLSVEYSWAHKAEFMQSFQDFRLSGLVELPLFSTV
jgi:hypothetical protein